MQPEVEYLGFKIKKQGVSPLKEKTETMQSVSKAKKYFRVEAILGLINYCHRHFKNFASFLKPLQKLLHKEV